MTEKIIDKYGEDAKECADGIEHGNLPEIAQCIANVVSDADPISVAGTLAAWSVECIFG